MVGTVLYTVVAASPAYAGGVGAGGSDNPAGHSTGNGHWGPGGDTGTGSGKGYTHSNSYKITSVWENRTNRGKAALPKPLGYYNDEGAKTNERPFYKTNRTVGQETKNVYAAKGFPCSQDVSNKVEDIVALSLGINWNQDVHWQATPGGGMQIDSVNITGVKCIGNTDIKLSERYCPIKITSGSTMGPYGTGLPGSPNKIHAGDALQKPAVFDLDKSFWNPSDAEHTKFQRTWNNGNFQEFDPEKKIDVAKKCASVEFEFDPPAIQKTANSIGFYKTRVPVDRRTCVWARFGSSEITKVTNVNATSNNRTFHTKNWAKETKWRGCGDYQTIYDYKTVSIRCRINPGTNKPELYREDVPAGYMGGTPPTGPWWVEGCAPKPIKLDCKVNNDPTLMVTGKSQGWVQNFNKRNTTLMADGKQASITWPVPELTPAAGSDTGEGAKTKAFARNFRVAYTQGVVDGMEAYPGFIGTGLSDPYSTNIALNGAQTSGWNNPLNLRFYRTPVHNTNTDKAGKMLITASYWYDTPTLIPVVDFDRHGKEVRVGDDVKWADTLCGSTDVEFWVATSRPSS